MKKKKFPIWWQIMIALILAILFGISFPNKYKVSDESFKLIESQKNLREIPEPIMLNLEIAIAANPMFKEEFINSILLNTGYKKNHKSLIFILEKTKFNPTVYYISPIGDIFLKTLKMLMIPLILLSAVAGVAKIGSAQNLGRITLKIFIYFFSTLLIAISIGLFFVNILKPGYGIDKSYANSFDLPEIQEFSIGSSLYNIFPENIFSALSEYQILPVFLFSLLFGFFIIKVKPSSGLLLSDFFNASLEVMMKLTAFIIKFTPIGVFALVAKIVADQSDQIFKMLEFMGMFGLTVILGLFFHSVIVLPIILKTFGNINPYTLFKSVRPALITAFAGASTAAALPVTLENVKNNAGVSDKISGLTIPLGASVNMNGTALYEAVAALFIAQAYGYDLGFFEQTIIVITALLVSMGSTATPGAGILMISIVLTSVDLPLTGLALILPLDKVLDMFKTTVNVWSDTCAAVIIAKNEGEKLKL